MGLRATFRPTLHRQNATSASKRGCRQREDTLGSCPWLKDPNPTLGFGQFLVALALPSFARCGWALKAGQTLAACGLSLPQRRWAGRSGIFSCPGTMHDEILTTVACTRTSKDATFSLCRIGRHIHTAQAVFGDVKVGARRTEDRAILNIVAGKKNEAKTGF